MTLKRLLKICLIEFPPARYLVLRLTRRVPRILMYHRFVDSHEGRIKGVPADAFSVQLGLLKDRFNIVSLADLFERCRRGEAPDYTAIITADDAYMDFYRLAYPILRRHGVPATLFVATDFIGRGKWFWWDKLNYVLNETGACVTSFSFDGVDFPIDLSTGREVRETWHRLADFCLRTTERSREGLIENLATAMKVEVPPGPAEGYRQADWPQIIELSRNMIEIGSHTLSHPILTALEEKDLRREVELSKEVIESKTGKAVRTFSYPNGKPRDYDRNTMEAVKLASYAGAVVAHKGRFDPDEPYRTPRMSVSEDMVEFKWNIYGFGLIWRRDETGE